MERTVTIKAGRAILPVVISLAAAAGVISILIMGIRVTGIEIINIFLQTSYYDYPVLLIGVPLILAGLFCVSACIGICRLFMKIPPRMPGLIPIVTPAMTVLFCVLAITFFRTHSQHIREGEPSAPELFRWRIGPVLQFGPFRERRADASTAAVVWYFDPEARSGPAEILFGTGPLQQRMARVAESAGDGSRHEFHLTGLAPSSRYYYRVPALDDRVRSFRTAPARGSGAAVRFMALADTGNTRRGESVNSYYSDVTRAAYGHYADMMDVPAFRVHAGDMVRAGDDLAGWREYFSADDRADTVPGIFAPGNHEYLNDGGGNFHYFFGQPEYHSIDFGDARIISIHPFDGPGRTLDGPILSTGNDQYRWVRGELARSAGVKWLIVVIHIPILSTGDYGTNELLVAQYFDLFKKHGVDLVISGHDHNFDIFQAGSDSPLYLVAGTGGSHLDSYIMDRRARRWPGWINAADTTAVQERPPTPAGGGIIQHHHIYGELSWGFTDVELRDRAMTVSYYRWLSFERFLEITGQDRQSWDMVDFDETARKRNNLSTVEPVMKAEKIP